MSIARLSDSLAADLPRLLLEAASSGKLDSDDFKDSYTIRDYTDKFLPVMTVISYRDTHNELSKYPDLSEEDKQDILKAVRAGLEKSTSLVQSISSTVLAEKMKEIALNNQLSEVQKAIKIRQLFTKGYVLSDSSKVIGEDGVVFIVSNFSAVGTRINKYVNAELKNVGKQTLGKYLDLGHSSVRYGDSSEYAFNSPKLTAVLFDIATSSKEVFVSKAIDLNLAANIYVKNTEQIEQSVTVTKDFGQGFVNIFVQFGGSVVTLENSVENQDRGRRLERAENKFGVNKTVLNKLVSKFKQIKETALVGQYNTSELSRIIRNLAKYSSSPSAIDHIFHQIVANLLGKPVETFNQTKSASKKTKITKTTKIVLPDTLRGGKKAKPSIRLQASPQTSLVSLQNLINANLADQIKKTWVMEIVETY